MTLYTYTFDQLVANPGDAFAFDPTVDLLDLQVAATAVEVTESGTQTIFVTAAGSVTLSMTMNQIVCTGGTGDNIRVISGQLVIGDNSLATIADANNNVGIAGANGMQFHGLTGNDSFYGAAGNDLAYGNFDADLLWGGSGDDTLYGGQNDVGVDILFGQNGNDVLYGNESFDLIYGNQGSDLIFGNSAGDTLYGGKANDILDGGGGHDLIYGNMDADTMYGRAGNDIMYGGQGNDVIAGNAGTNVIYGNLGDDIILGGDGDRLYGGQGMDNIMAGSGADLVYGNLGADQLVASAGADTVYGGQGADVIIAGAGDDDIHGNMGGDNLYGGAGSDTFHFRPGQGTDVDVIHDYSYVEDSLQLTGVTVRSTVQVGADVLVTLTSGDQILFKNSTASEIAADLRPWLPSFGGGGGGGGAAPTPTPTPTTPAPTLVLGAVTGTEDVAVALDIQLTANATGQTISVLIEGVPTGAILSAGIDNGDNSWTLTDAELVGLTLTPVAHDDTDLNLTVTATATKSGANPSSATDTYAIAMTAAADAPSLSAATVTGTEDGGAIALNITAALVDTDLSESLSIDITGVPSVATLSAGTDNGGGSWTLTTAELVGLTLTPVANYGGSFDLTVTATATEASNNDTAQTVVVQTVNVTAVADTPTLTLTSTNFGDTSGSEFRVNTVTNDYQDYPSVAGLAGGGYAITWQSFTQDGDNAGVYARMYNADGTTNGSEFLVNKTTTGRQDYPDIAGLKDGGFVVVWESYGQDNSTSAGVYGQLYTSAGAENGTEFLINTETALDQKNASVAALDDGGFVVTWQSDGQDGDLLGVYGQRYKSDGSKNGTEFRINETTASYQDIPQVVGLTGGGFAVAWQSTDQDGDGFGICAQTYDSTGTKDVSEFVVNTVTTNNQDFPEIGALEDGGFVVVWHSTAQDGDQTGVYAQRYNADGSKYGTYFQVNTYTTGYQDYAAVAGLSDGGFVITYQSQGQDGNNLGIYGRRYAADNTAMGEEFLIPTTTTNNEDRPSVDALDNGGFVVAWYADGDVDGSQTGVYAQYFLPPAYEDKAIELGISAALADTDTSETLTVLIDGVPTGATLSAGTDNGNGSWTVTEAQLAGLTLTPPEGSAETITLTVSATATETSNNDPATTATQTITIDIFGINDTITGTAAAETIIGGGGDDSLTGNGGADTFVYSSTAWNGHDVITDFTAGSDVIDLDALFDDLGTATASRSGLVVLADNAGAAPTELTITGYADFSVTLDGVKATDLTVGTDIWLGTL